MEIEDTAAEASAMYQLYEDLFRTALKNLAFLVPVKGSRYGPHRDVRMMLVGRALNGWKENETLGECAKRDEESEAYSGSAFAQKAMRILDEGGGFRERFPNAGACVRTSAFWHTAQEIYNHLTETKESDWYENIVWCNLYPISPLIAGNPSDGFCDGLTEISAKLLEQYILRFDPTHILFVTGYDRFRKISERMDPNLFTGLDPMESEESLVAAKGNCAGRRIVITKRPEYKPKALYVEQSLRAFGREV